MIKKYYVKKFVKDINKDYKVKFDKYFEVDIDEEIVYIATKENKEEDKMFFDFCKKEFGVNDSMNCFVLGLLHEIGHLETYDPDLDDERDFLYSMLKLQYNSGNYSVEEFNNMYFHIPAEYEATKWGIEYYKSNKEKCDKLEKEIMAK